ncbi:protein of unknown function [Methylorubrum extorquens]|uniref:Uncharacterized protein n=1 Tax=Methylorubrum extorquens TaxID=408 RepID=A0A2N9AYZ8_METEX|nr:protein of unknown function [Methylorubrum extorquens]
MDLILGGRCSSVVNIALFLTFVIARASTHTLSNVFSLEQLAQICLT